MEVSEVKDRLNDALNATKAAVEEGIVPRAQGVASRRMEESSARCTKKYVKKIMCVHVASLYMYIYLYVYIYMYTCVHLFVDL